VVNGLVNQASKRLSHHVEEAKWQYLLWNIAAQRSKNHGHSVGFAAFVAAANC
jgi:hypothetical protein